MIKYDGHRRIRLPYLGSVRTTRALPDGNLYEVTVRRRNGRWYASVAYWKPPVAPPQRETQSVGGVDVGISPLAMDSGGEHSMGRAHYQPAQTASGHWEYHNPKGFGNALKTLGRWQRAQSRRTPGSRGVAGSAAPHRPGPPSRQRLAGQRHHHISRALVAKYHTLGIETLNVAGMIRAGLQSKALSDAGMSGLLDQIRYKAQWHGTRIVEADQWYPSSKTCSSCGVVNASLGREPKWSCPSCGAIHGGTRTQPATCRNLRYSR